MKHSLQFVFIVVALVVGGAGPGAAASLRYVFDSSKPLSEWRIPLGDISPQPAADWPQDGHLLMEMRASSSQRFDLRIYTPDGYSRILFHPYPGVWIRAAIPLSLLWEAPRSGIDMAAVGNRSRPGYFIGLWGPFRPLKHVQAIAFAMEHPIGTPSLEIRTIQISATAATDAILESGPLVDEFGQYMRGDWPGKAKSLDDLRKDWDDEGRSLSSGDFGYCSYGGYLQTSARATGYFRVERIDGHWWFVDPDGHLFLSAGCDVMGPASETRTKGREAVFQTLPPEGLRSERIRDGDPGASFLTWNLVRRFGQDWLKKWIEISLRRMDAWGLNTVGNWSHPSLWETHKKSYVIPLGNWATGVNYLGLPDVYSEAFARNADQSAQSQCEPRRNDPWLLGYFLANEPPFPQKELQTVELILAGSDTATQRELKKWLATGDTPERRKEFIDRAFDRYVQVTSQAVKRYDPNHLNLGMRSGGRPTDAEIRVARHFDVYSVNIYDFEVKPERVRRISELTGKPVIIGEFHFGTPGRGLAASLVQVRDQAERGVAYRYYVENAFAMPELIGTHWFQWVDQPCTGRFDGENYNIGLVDVTDRPYLAMVEALKATHRRLRDVHSGKEKPVSQRALSN